MHARAQAVWLIGGEQSDADELVARVPAAAGAHPVLIPQEPFAAAYSAEMNVSDGSPSTGFAGARLFRLLPPEDIDVLCRRSVVSLMMRPTSRASHKSIQRCSRSSEPLCSSIIDYCWLREI